jgi:hypothetical protein
MKSIKLKRQGRVGCERVREETEREREKEEECLRAMKGNFCAAKENSLRL